MTVDDKMFSIEFDNFPKVSLSPEMIKIAYEKAVELSKGGVSRVRKDKEDRMDHLFIDNLNGTMVEIGYHIYIFKKLDLYYKHYKEAQERYEKLGIGDGGSDIPGMKFDAKGTKIPEKKDRTHRAVFSKYRLFVSKEEYSPETVYGSGTVRLPNLQEIMETWPNITKSYDIYILGLSSGFRMRYNLDGPNHIPGYENYIHELIPFTEKYLYDFLKIINKRTLLNIYFKNDVQSLFEATVNVLSKYGPHIDFLEELQFRLYKDYVNSQEIFLL